MDAAIEFGRSARLFGDNIDRLVQGFRNQSQTRDFVDGCVKESDPGQATSTALQSFIEVARLVFEVDEGGLGMASIDVHLYTMFIWLVILQEFTLLTHVMKER